MPFLDEIIDNPLQPQGLVQPPDTKVPDAPFPGLWPTIGAAFRQGNTIGSVMARQDLGVDNEVEHGYDPWKSISGTKYEQHWSSFVDVNNSRLDAARKRQIDMEEEDRRTMAASGWTGAFVGLGAGLVDPTMLVPGAGIARGASGAYSIGRSALMNSVAMGAAMGAQELVLQGSQELRTGEESAVAIGSGIILGGLLGGGAAAFLGRQESAQAMRAYDTMHRVAGGELSAETGAPLVSGRAASAGAAAVETATKEDLGYAGGWLTQTFMNMTSGLNPVLRDGKRAVAEARLVGQKVNEVPLYTVENMAGRTSIPGGAAETEYKALLHGRLGNAISESDDIFKQMKKAGAEKLSRAEFEERIGHALRNGDADELGNEYIGRAAQVWRSKVFDPFKDEAIELGLLPKDVPVETALSYFSRVYNRDMMVARETDFKALVQPYVEQRIQAEFAEHSERTQTAINALKQDVADLQLSPEARVAAINDLRARGSALDAANSEHVDRVSQINDLQRKLDATDDAMTKTGIRSEIKRIRDEGGDGLKAYLSERRGLRRRMANADLGYAGLQSRADQVAARLSENEEAAFRTLERLVTKGQVFERELQRLDSAKLDAKLTSLRDSFHSTGRQFDQGVERIVKMREKIATQLEAAKAPAVEGKPAPVVDVAGLQKQDQLLAAAENAQRERAQKMSRITQRLDAAENLDREALLAEIRNGVDLVKAQVADRALGLGERNQRLIERMQRLDPQQVADKVAAKQALAKELERKFYERWEGKTLGEGVELGAAKAGFTDAAKEIVNEVFDKIVGRAHGDPSNLPSFGLQITRGVLKDRTFMVPDAVIKDFLHNNVREVGERYARQMAGEISLAKRSLNGKADMADDVLKVRQAYNALREKVGAAKTGDEALQLVGQSKDVLDSFKAWQGKDTTKVTKERVLKFLDDDERGWHEDFQARMEKIRGTYKMSENASPLGTFVRRANAFNYVRLSGGFLISSLNDFYHAAFSHGLSEFIGGGLVPLTKNLAAIKMSVEEAKLAGLVAERVLQHRLQTIAEFADPFAKGTAVDRMLQNGSRLATKWNGMALWQDVNEGISAVLTQNRLLKGVTSGKDGKWLAYLGLDANLQSRIAKQFAAYGDKMDGAFIANTQKWTDEQAVSAYRSAIQKYTTTAVVKPGIGDVPNFASTPVGKALLQFRSFSLAAHQRTTLRAMQEGPQQFLSGLVGTFAIGGLVAYLAAVRGGKERMDKWLESAKNPGFFVGEALDRGGMMPIMFEVANAFEKASQSTGKVFNPIKTPMQAAFPNAPQEGQSGRTMGRDFWAAIGGPTVGLPTEILRAAGGGIATFKGEDPNKMQKRAQQGLTPFGSMFGMREGLQLLHGDSPWQR